ncbi:MAG: putative transposase [Oleiphilaceae bacterium]
MYGSPRITHEQRRSSETCGENRVAKLMKQAKLRANIGYKRHYIKPSTPHISADNHLQQQFVVCEPDTAWVGDITYIKTYEGWLYLAVVLDLFSRKVIGWSMQPTTTSDIVIKALPMTVRQNPQATQVIVHSDPGSQYASGDYRDFLKAHNLTPSMSRRGHCLDNAVAESFFQSLKTECVKRKVYATRSETKANFV